jgi:hypothetical protein
MLTSDKDTMANQSNRFGKSFKSQQIPHKGATVPDDGCHRMRNSNQLLKGATIKKGNVSIEVSEHSRKADFRIDLIDELGICISRNREHMRKRHCSLLGRK